MPTPALPSSVFSIGASLRLRCRGIDVTFCTYGIKGQVPSLTSHHAAEHVQSAVSCWNTSRLYCSNFVFPRSARLLPPCALLFLLTPIDTFSWRAPLEIPPSLHGKASGSRLTMQMSLGVTQFLQFDISPLFSQTFHIRIFLVYSRASRFFMETCGRE